MIHQVRLKNFRRYKDATLVFEAGSNFIRGDNNVGKTTLFYSIEYVFFGSVARSGRLHDLLMPKSRSFGVEIIFEGDKQRKFRLQRMHEKPPRAKTKFVGHFTLKEILADEREVYLLSSDFGDREEQLAWEIYETLGITKRLFEVVLHMQQGKIASILEGIPQLDHILGVTAATAAEEEVRALALSLKKEAQNIESLEETQKFLLEQKQDLEKENSKLEERQKFSQEKMVEVAKERGEIQQLLAILQDASIVINSWQESLEEKEKKLAQVYVYQQQLEDLRKKKSSQPPLRKLNNEIATKEKQKIEFEARIVQQNTEILSLERSLGDLQGRLQRRQSLPKGEGAICETCGQEIKQEQQQREQYQWQKELLNLDQQLEFLRKGLEKDQQQLQECHNKEQEIRQELLLGEKILSDIEELETQLKNGKGQDDDIVSEKIKQEVWLNLESIAKFIAFSDEKSLQQWQQDPSISLTKKLQEDLQQALQQKMVRFGVIEEQQRGLEQEQQHFQEHQALQSKKTLDIDKQLAQLTQQIRNLKRKQQHIERLRNFSSGFQELQKKIREAATSQLATTTEELHAKISEDKEFELIELNPKNYSLLVRPQGFSEKTSAAFSQGGGQKTLLGLSLRLAIAKIAGKCPFLLLDEPTYGLDFRHRKTLISHLENLDFVSQLIIVTHHEDSSQDRWLEVLKEENHSIVREVKGIPSG